MNKIYFPNLHLLQSYTLSQNINRSLYFNYGPKGRPQSQTSEIPVEDSLRLDPTVPFEIFAFNDSGYQTFLSLKICVKVKGVCQ